jgi:repressor LexA
MPEALTPLERRVYHYLLDFLVENTYQPSVREIGRQFRIKSTKTVADILQSLAAKGYIEREPGRSRGVRLLGLSSVGQVQPVPLYPDSGTNGATRTDQERERFIAMDRSCVPTDDAFFVRVPDAGMIERGLQEGDLVLVNPAARAHDGEPVVARVGSDVVVRMMAHRGAELVLAPAADGYAETTLGPTDDYAILGTVAAVLRPFHQATGEPVGVGALTEAVGAPPVT